MNHDAFFKKKEANKALEDQRYLFVLTQMLVLMQEKQQARLHMLLACMRHLRYLHLQRRKLKKELFWQQQTVQDAHYKLIPRN